MTRCTCIWDRLLAVLLHDPACPYPPHALAAEETA